MPGTEGGNTPHLTAACNKYFLRVKVIYSNNKFESHELSFVFLLMKVFNRLQ